ncbi:flagellar basal-body MS-ring/collar protein FliF [Sporolituus thermophilus]|uniref:Flagellar M-ring protein n=1 Tax=Sporolituus thermophilus DSM 23256 TaxID=1123285 RepID=A0A1G7KPI1_9FIRM|nr:flagellar basal-body MS-ring/collar protein FliF [Sporolituus thermophilus]SDF38850.1 flagellar M-ring protein FliF [Sporolituus thermophilus DSM 23256]
MADWKEQSLQIWRSLGKKQRYLIAASAFFVFAVILLWSYWWGGRIDYVPLYTGLDLKDAGEVVSKLKEMKVPHQIEANGTAILVPAKDVHRVRLELASQGLPRGYKGFEIFDQTKFGVTDFQQKVYLLQALQGELTRTIEQMAEVEKARVHIVLSEDSLYKKNEKPATASVMLKLRPGVQLSREQVRGIVNLVAHSIQGLKPENVTVVDNYARVLNDQMETPFTTGAITVTQLELTKKIQEDLQKNIHTLLEQVLGPGKAAARVNVELNFDQRTIDRQTFEPVADDKGIIRSMQEMSESYRGSAPAPGGVPGTTANIPGYVTGANNQSNYEKKEITRNYEINETKERVVTAPGTIKRLTVAVLIDASIDRAKQESIAKTVASAVGLNPSRGDTISVESIPFSTELQERQRREEQALEQQQRQELWLRVGAAAIGLIALLYIVRLLVRRRLQKEELEVVTIAPPQPQPVPAKSKELTPQEKERLQQREAVAKLAKSKPEEVAHLIKTWLAEE